MISRIVATVTSGCIRVGPEDLADLDKLFSTVTEACMLLQRTADSLDRTPEWTTFICSCNALCDLCEREKLNRLET